MAAIISSQYRQCGKLCAIYLGALQDKHVSLIVTLEELEIEFDGLLPEQDASQLVVYWLRVL